MTYMVAFPHKPMGTAPHIWLTSGLQKLHFINDHSTNLMLEFFVLYHGSVLGNVCNPLSQMSFLGTLICGGYENSSLEEPTRAPEHPVHRAAVEEK